MADDRKFLAICDEQSQKVGELASVHEDDVAQLAYKGNPQEFIVLCAAAVPEHILSEASPGPGYTSEWTDDWLLHVMLIERDSTEPCVVRRIAIGTIGTISWKQCNPRWETFVLR